MPEFGPQGPDGVRGPDGPQAPVGRQPWDSLQRQYGKQSWMEKNAPEVLEEEERLALREELLKLQEDYDSSHEAEQHD